MAGTRLIAGMGHRRRITRIVGTATCLVALLAVAAPPAGAEVVLRVSPLIVELEGEAGDRLTQPISVTAEGDAMVVELVHADFGFEDTSYELTLIRDDAPDTTAFSTRGWFSVPRERYRIPAGRTVELPLRIDIPENTPGGTYLGAALVRVVPPDADPGASQVQAVPEAGPLLFIAVEGGDPPRPALRSFDVPRAAARGPIRPRIVVENRGDEFFSYEGTITLAGPGKDETVDIARQFVVPGQPRTLRTAPEDEGAAGRPALGDRDLRFGRYEVRTRLRIQPTGTSLVSSRTIWVVPAWVRALAAVLAIVLAASIALLVRWALDRRMLALYGEEEDAEAAEGPVHEHEHPDEEGDGPVVR